MIKIKTKEKSVNFPRDWLVTRFFMAFHCGMVQIVGVLYFCFLCLAHVNHHHDSYCTCSFVFFRQFFFHFIHLLHHCTNYICEEKKEENTLELCVCVLMFEQFAISFKWNKPAHSGIHTHTHNIDLERIFFILIMCMFTCKQSATESTKKNVFRYGKSHFIFSSSLHQSHNRKRKRKKKWIKKWLSLLTLYVLFQFNCLQWCSLLRVRKNERRKKKNKNYTRKWRIVICSLFAFFFFPWQITTIKSFVHVLLVLLLLVR